MDFPFYQLSRSSHITQSTWHVVFLFPGQKCSDQTLWDVLILFLVRRMKSWNVEFVWLTLWVLITTKVICLCHLLKSLRRFFGIQCISKSDGSCMNRLNWVLNVCPDTYISQTRQIRRIYIPPTKGYLRETCKSQNINPIYLTLSSPTVSFRS